MPAKLAFSAELETIVYYFYGSVRCPTCHKMEEYTKETIAKNFQDEVASGLLVLKTINIEEKENEHFVKDYQLYTKSLILSQVLKGSFMLGIIFALSFCPIAAALFFGSLIPLALKSTYGMVLPLFYGIGTGIPVIIFSGGIAMGVKSFSKWFGKARVFEAYTRKITGAIFLIVGLYFSWTYIIVKII